MVHDSNPGPLRNQNTNDVVIAQQVVILVGVEAHMRWFPLVLVQLACTVQFDDASAPLDSESVDDTDAAMDGDTSDTNEDETDPPLESLVDAMDLERLLRHLAALQAIADEHSDTRVVGSSGFNQSADYVASQLEAAGFDVTWQEFTHSDGSVGRACAGK